MKQLTHVTFSIREDHVQFLKEISENYALRSRSAALAFLIEDYKRLYRQEIDKMNFTVTDVRG